MLKKYIFIITLLIFSTLNTAEALTKLFYTMRDDKIPNLRDHYRVMRDIEKHHDKISILVAQAYVISAQGVVFMGMEPDLKNLAEKNKIKLMPLVTNEKFDANKVSAFLKNQAAQQLAIHSLVNICKNNHYYGLQIDFEHLLRQDRNAFTQFYTHVAKALRAIHCKVSVAIVPERHTIPPSRRLLERNLHWSGGYDQKRLGTASDFVVLMTYNQNGPATTPGPNASVFLDKAAIQFALKNIPQEKLFLGIPTDSTYWGIQGNVGTNIASNQAALLKKMHHLTWSWDKRAKVHYAIFPYHDFYHYLFVEDADSFDAKRQLAKQYQLAGIAVFRLGNEDPNLWEKIT